MTTDLKVNRMILSDEQQYHLLGIIMKRSDISDFLAVQIRTEARYDMSADAVVALTPSSLDSSHILYVTTNVRPTKAKKARFQAFCDGISAVLGDIQQRKALELDSVEA